MVLKEDTEVLWIQGTTGCMAKVAQETIVYWQQSLGIQASLINDPEKLTVVPSRGSGSTSLGSCATSPDVAVLNCATRPGSTVLCRERPQHAGKQWETSGKQV